MAHQTQTTVAHQRVESGPLPSADAMGRYAQIIPNGAERIMAMAEREQAHVHAMQAKAIEAEALDLQQSRDERRRGQFCAMMIGIAALVASCFIANVGHPVSAGFVGTGGLATLLMAFLVDHNRKTTEPAKKPTKP